MRVFVFATLLSTFIISTTAAQVGDLAGSWKGTWTKDGDALPITVKFAKRGNAYSGTLDSDALQVAGIPLANVSDRNARVHFEIKGDESTAVFDGTITGDEMSGTFAEGSAKGSFDLSRAVLPVAQIRTRDVAFQDRDVTLAGTLLLPATSGSCSSTVQDPKVVGQTIISRRDAPSEASLR